MVAKIQLIFIFCGILINHVNSNNKFCKHLNKVVIPRAKAEIKRTDEVLNAHMEAGISLTPDQPGSSFLRHDDIPDEEHTFFKNAEISLMLSESVAKYHYPNGVPQFTDLRKTLNKHTSCLKDFFSEHCEGNSKLSCANMSTTYRPIDGICTTPTAPKSGSGDTHYGSMVKPYFEDGVQSFRRAIGTHDELPGARLLTNIFFHNCKNIKVKPVRSTLGGVMFGQLFTHDVSYKEVPRAKAKGFGIQCCSKDGKSTLPMEDMNPNCAPMLIPKNDPSLPKRRCSHFLRTQAVNDNNCVLTTRTQLNEQTSYMDLSNVYSQHHDLNHELRTLTDGQMKLDEKGIFAKDDEGEYIFPDDRANQTPALAFLHSIWLRVHNTYARAFKAQKPNLDDETIFQEARRFVIATYQHIVVNEWIQTFIGNAKNRLRAPRSYDAKTTNEFAQAALRVGHHYSPERFYYYDKNGRISSAKYLSDVIFDLEELERSYDDVARGLIYQRAENNGCRDQMVNRVFKNPDGIGLDLISMDTQRGRDHGVAPYHVFVKLCHGIKLKSFSDLRRFHSQSNIDKLRKVYRSVLDIDLMIGGTLESDVYKYIFGPTFTCIINEQIDRYRNGDIFFFDNPANPNPFTPTQLAEIKKATWAGILCENTGITKIQRKAFINDSYKNPIVKCSKIRKPSYKL